MFAGKKAALRPIYDRVLELAFGLGKDVKVSPGKTIVPFYRKHVFAQVKPTTNTRIDVGFAFKDMKPSGKLVATGGFEKGDRITHRIPAESVAGNRHGSQEMVKTRLRIGCIRIPIVLS